MNFYGCIVRFVIFLFVVNVFFMNIEVIVFSIFEVVMGGEFIKVIVGKLIIDVKLEICKLEEFVSFLKVIVE